MDLNEVRLKAIEKFKSRVRPIIGGGRLEDEISSIFLDVLSCIVLEAVEDEEGLSFEDVSLMEKEIDHGAIYDLTNKLGLRGKADLA